VDNGNCSHNCTNLIPGHQCSCLDGFILDSDDNRTCSGKESSVLGLERAWENTTSGLKH